MLVLERLESSRDGTRLLAVRERDGRQLATVYVPERGIEKLLKKIEQYLNETTRKGERKNRALVDGLGDIRTAVLQSFWTDPPELLPQEDEAFWSEVWLRRDDPTVDVASIFRDQAARLGVTVDDSQPLPFPERVVLLAHGTLSQLADCTQLLCSIAELRRARETPSFFLDLKPGEERDWTDDALGRMRGPPEEAPVVCVLDTGTDFGHPLLSPVLDEEACHTYDPDWGIDDHSGHGTGMAGLAAWGDLVDAFDSVDILQLTHRLESVKILPPQGQNEAKLWGSITIAALALAEIDAPDVRRVACLASTAKEAPFGGPSSWSSALDTLASGADDGLVRLLCVSAGNVGQDCYRDYPTGNELRGIEDPAQAWNALTVGAYTDRHDIREDGYDGWTPLAVVGDLSPHSRTSVGWEHRKWPLKPEVVFEGGNLVRSSSGSNFLRLDSLDLLSTDRLGQGGLFRPMCATSAATALCSRMAAQIMATYPALWPESVRALVVHSARWTPAMLERYLPERPRQEHWMTLLRCCGHGVPDLGRALHSAQNSLTLIVQESLQPFDKDGGRRVMRDMHLHPLPWPVDALGDLGNTQVQMRVTLSYFIEPSPGERGWGYKHRYASHGLRFHIKGPTEQEDAFRQRINKAAREEEDGRTQSIRDDGWTLGAQLRSLGSIHSDTWRGPAADLAERGLIGIVPVVGWWRERAHLGRVDRSARYALVVSIQTPEEVLGTEIDIYTPVATELGVGLPVEV